MSALETLTDAFFERHGIKYPDAEVRRLVRSAIVYGGMSVLNKHAAWTEQQNPRPEIRPQPY